MPHQPLLVDLHSHLLPAIDDGVQSMEESIDVIKGFIALGYKKIITTPHIMSDVYKNSPEIINEKLLLLQDALKRLHLHIDVSAAAEYYLDEGLLQNLRASGPLMTFGKNYLLFETNFLSEPFFLKDFIFEATTKGYKLVFAHPERYIYLQQDFGKVEDLLNRGLTFQVNLASLTGHYSKQAQKLAHQLIDRGWVHWLASDCHKPVQLALLKEAFSMKYFEKAINLPLLNNSLL